MPTGPCKPLIVQRLALSEACYGYCGAAISASRPIKGQLNTRRCALASFCRELLFNSFLVVGLANGSAAYAKDAKEAQAECVLPAAATDTRPA